MDPVKREGGRRNWKKVCEVEREKRWEERELHGEDLWTRRVKKKKFYRYSELDGDECEKVKEWEWSARVIVRAFEQRPEAVHARQLSSRNHYHMLKWALKNAHVYLEVDLDQQERKKEREAVIREEKKKRGIFHELKDGLKKMLGFKSKKDHEKHEETRNDDSDSNIYNAMLRTLIALKFEI
ncbi:hypothetical protein AMTR_s00061p00168170 [Amborella trichopoda]|uniref:Uncharacterized protein n=1 Tax=Amborella trichopoda TaxID=13333 RepID=U5DFH1_AMBTC|nr:hypothetical protein AMTR_s00061p00168170 [Amborella trichopoda]